jgi:hypothetical protein
MQQPIANILHQETIRRLSGDGAFERGKAYYDEGRVAELQRKDGSVQAQVRGSKEHYAVRIWMKDESLAYACSCPQGQEQAFCKHAVALALALLKGSPREILKGLAREPETQKTPSPIPPAVETAASVAARATPPSPVTASVPAAPKTSLADALRALPHETLVVVLLEAALDDDAFRERLVQRLRRQP